MSAPLVVGAVCGRPECGHGEDLHDGICFGTACECVRFVESAGALPVPVPVGPEPQALSDADELAAFRALELGDLDGRVSASCGNPSHPTWLRVKIDPRGCPWCEIDQAHQDVIGANLARHEEEQENVTLRARVAELEAELLVANGVLDDVARARQSGVACPCPSADRPHQVGCPEDGVPSPSFAERADRETDPARRTAYRMLAEPEPEFHAFLHHENRVGHDLPETGGTR